MEEDTDVFTDVFTDPLGERWHVVKTQVRKKFRTKEKTMYLHAESREFLWDEETMALWVQFADPSSAYPATRISHSIDNRGSGPGR